LFATTRGEIAQSMSRQKDPSMTIRARTISLILIAAFALFGSVGASGAVGESVRETLNRLYRHAPGTQGLIARSAGVLVFPTVVKAGIGVGGEYGEGELLIHGQTVGRYNTVAASIGFQLGAQARSVIIVFMTPGALNQFQRVDGFKVGVDGSVAIITVGAGGSVDTDKITSPVVGFILNPQGLMYNLTLEGSKITRIR
jgi:lipid-binding SYLF domain-containing protein